MACLVVACLAGHYERVVQITVFGYPCTCSSVPCAYRSRERMVLKLDGFALHQIAHVRLFGSLRRSVLRVHPLTALMLANGNADAWCEPTAPDVQTRSTRLMSSVQVTVTCLKALRSVCRRRGACLEANSYDLDFKPCIAQTNADMIAT